MPEPGRPPPQGCRGGRPSLAVAVNLKRLRTARTALLILIGFACIVAGIWTVIADIFGPVIGAGSGLVASGVAFLVIEGLSAGDQR